MTKVREEMGRLICCQSWRTGSTDFKAQKNHPWPPPAALEASRQTLECRETPSEPEWWWWRLQSEIKRVNVNGKEKSEKQYSHAAAVISFILFCSPSRSSSASSGYKPAWAPLDLPDGERERDTWGLLSVERAADEYEAWQDYECVFSHSALILLLDGGSSPQGVDTIHCHGHAEVWLRLPALQPQLLHHRPHHITAALHTSDSLRQETPTEAWIQCLRKGNQRELKEEFHWFYMSKSVYRPWGERISDWKMHRNLLWLKRVLREVR